MFIQKTKKITPSEKTPAPATSTTKIPTPPPRNPITILLVFTALGLCIWLSSEFWEPFKNNPNLDQEELEAVMKEAAEIVERHEIWVQYVLLANYTASRPCLRCPSGIPIVTVKTGEIYKYGITTQGKGRYADNYYLKLGVTYLEEFRGSYEECKANEINKIMAYRFLPQSKKPEVQLVRPPGNASKN